MNNIETKEHVISLLESIDICKSNSSHTQFVVKCPMCESYSTKDHGHLSIKVDINDDSAMVFRCFKCDYSGILTDSLLNELGFYVNDDLSAGIKSFNKKIVKTNKFINDKILDYKVPEYNNSKLNQIKINYINDRLETSIQPNECNKLKIILDVFDFIKLNNIESIPNIDIKYLNFINMNYVGFLSTNNNCITFRNFNNKYRRYLKVKLDPFNINGNSFYSIPNTLNLTYTHDINIHICEGTFDILSVYYNIHNGNLENNYYYAACGFGYISILKFLISNGINTGLNIHIYSDNDKTDNDHYKYLYRNSLIEWLDHIYIHRNLYPGEKDFGVSVDRINEGIFKMQ